MKNGIAGGPDDIPVEVWKFPGEYGAIGKNARKMVEHKDKEDI